MTIEVKGTHIYRHSRHVAMVMGTGVFWTKELSKADQRKVREILKEQQGIDVTSFAKVGTFVSD